MSAPSKKAVEVAWAAFPGDDPDAARGVLLAAHDPALGLDRSVCLRDVVAWLRTDDGPTTPEHDVADAIEREFGAAHD